MKNNIILIFLAVSLGSIGQKVTLNQKSRQMKRSVVKNKKSVNLSSLDTLVSNKKTLIRENSLNYFKKWVDWENSILDKHYKNVLIPKLKDDSDSLFNHLFELKGKDVAKVVFQYILKTSCK